MVTATIPNNLIASYPRCGYDSYGKKTDQRTDVFSCKDVNQEDPILASAAVFSVAKPIQFKKAKKRLAAIQALQDNWDSYGGNKPIIESLQAAFQTLKFIQKYCTHLRAELTKEPSFAPAPDGIVGFEWTINHKELFIRFIGNYKIEAFGVDQLEDKEFEQEGTITDLPDLLTWLFT
jgi:hypothetical protein